MTGDRPQVELAAAARRLVGDLWDDDVAVAVERNPEASAAVVRLLADPPRVDRGRAGGRVPGLRRAAGRAGVRDLAEGAGPGYAGARRPTRSCSSESGDHLTITLHRPECHNAVDVAMRDALVEAFELVAADPALTATLQGDGPSFCSGGDLREFGTFPDPATAHAVRLERLPARALAAVADRVTARVHGHCVGAGAELAAFCHRVDRRPRHHLPPARRSPWASSPAKAAPSACPAASERSGRRGWR